MVSWKIVKKRAFVRQYKNMGGQRQFRVDLAVKEITDSDDPAVMGRYKKSTRVFAYEIGQSDRLIYRIEHGHHRIVLMRVCDHKSVYGKD